MPKYQWKKIEIKTLLDAKFSQRHIANALGVLKTCVFGVAKKLDHKLPLTNLPGQGRKKTSTSIDDRHLLNLCKKDRTKSSEELSAELVLSNGKTLSARTVRRRLLNMGYKSYVAKKKPFRKPSNKKERFSFAKKHQNWSKEWNNIIFSDESHFELYNRKNRTYVRRLKNEVNEPFNFVPRVQGGGGHVSVWGCISGGARGPLVMYTGNLNGPAYIKLIEEALPFFIQNAFDSSSPECVFMQDNAPPHRSAYAKNWFENNNINLFKWPATSPDLNPIENVWDHIDKQLRRIKPSNVIQLQDMIEDIWDKFTCMKCQKLVDSMPSRIKQYIKSRGGTFNKY